MFRLRTGFISLLLICLACFAAFAAAKKYMSVQVREGMVRTTPSFLGKVVGELSYGDRVAVSEEKNKWAKVEMSGKGRKGWMHLSALTIKKVVLNPGADDVEEAASSNEIALAGKGFSEEVEKSYKAKNKQLNYKEVDKMEKIAVSQAKIKNFLKEGGLMPEGGLK